MSRWMLALTFSLLWAGCNDNVEFTKKQNVTNVVSPIENNEIPNYWQQSFEVDDIEYVRVTHAITYSVATRTSLYPSRWFVSGSNSQFEHRKTFEDFAEETESLEPTSNQPQSHCDQFVTAKIDDEQILYFAPLFKKRTGNGLGRGDFFCPEHFRTDEETPRTISDLMKVDLPTPVDGRPKRLTIQVAGEPNESACSGSVQDGSLFFSIDRREILANVDNEKKQKESFQDFTAAGTQDCEVSLKKGELSCTIELLGLLGDEVEEVYTPLPDRLSLYVRAQVQGQGIRRQEIEALDNWNPQTADQWEPGACWIKGWSVTYE